MYSEEKDQVKYAHQIHVFTSFISSFQFSEAHLLYIFYSGHTLYTCVCKRGMPVELVVFISLPFTSLSVLNIYSLRVFKKQPQNELLQ